MKKILFSLIFLISLSSVRSQDRFLRKAKSAIDDRDRNRAIEMVSSYESKEGAKPEASFMRFLINVSFGHTIQEMDECWDDLTKATYKFNLLSEKEKKEWCEDIDFCADKLAYYVDLADSMIYDEYKRTNDLNTISLFISKYNESKWRENALVLRSYLAYKIAAEKNTEEDYLTYLKTYTGLPYIDSAKALLWKAVYEKVTNENTISSYERFIRSYSEAPQVSDIKLKLWDLAWKDAVNKNKKADFQSFISKYPQAAQVGEAKMKIEDFEWEETISNVSIAGFEYFTKTYPNSNHFSEADATLKDLKKTKSLEDAITEGKDDVSHLRFSHAEEILKQIDNSAPVSFLSIKDSLLSRIAYLKPLLKQTLGRYIVNIKGIEVIMVLGVTESDSSLFCKIKSFSKGEPINGIESDGSFDFEQTGGKLNMNWDVESFNNAMSAITVVRAQNKSSLKLSNGTIYKKLSDDFDSEIESTVKAPVKPTAPSSTISKKIVCQTTWKTISDLEDILEGITDDWQQYVDNEVRSEYREFTEDIQVTGGNARGIYITAKGSTTGATFKILWTCNGTVIVYDAIAN